MRIAVVGVGHVGLVSAAAFGRWGHDVVVLDDDAAKVATLREGRAWFYEPGLQELLDEVIAAVSRWREFADEAGVDPVLVDEAERNHRLDFKELIRPSQA